MRRRRGATRARCAVVAVSKTVGIDAIAAVAAGAHDFGENRPDPFWRRRAFPEQTWHFIGNIQSRRIPDIVRSPRSSTRFSRSAMCKIEAAAAAGKVQDVLWR